MADLQPINLAPATGLSATDVLVVQNGSTGEVDSVTADKFPIQGTPQSRMSNPYKFSVYRNAAMTTNSSATLVPFDTKLLDTGNNIDTTTNKGRFTAPIAGFYYFSSVFGNSAIGAGGLVFIQLVKNGVSVKTGDAKTQATAGQPLYGSISGLLQLAAGDYVEIYCTAGLGSSAGVGQLSNFFDGFLISAT